MSELTNLVEINGYLKTFENILIKLRSVGRYSEARYMMRNIKKIVENNETAANAEQKLNTSQPTTPTTRKLHI